MPASTVNLLNNHYILGFEKGAILLILIFYAIFALVIIRQVDSMSKTLITGVSPKVKAFAVFHGGFALALIILAWGIL